MTKRHEPTTTTEPSLKEFLCRGLAAEEGKDRGQPSSPKNTTNGPSPGAT